MTHLDPDFDGKELWDIQKDFNDKFFSTRGGWPKKEDLTDESKNFAIHLIKEATEVLDEMSFKMHRASKGEIDRDNVLEELVDVQKFLWGWMQIWGFTWDDFREEFKRKSQVVEQRFAQEQTFPKLVNDPCCIIDLDGVVAEYPGGFYKWCIKNFFGRHSLHEFDQLYKKMDLLAREDLKKRYRQSGEKAFLPLVPGARELLDCVRRKSNLKIILMTNRPYSEYYRIYPDTLAWLKRHEIPYDALLWSRDKGVDALKQFKNVCWAVDDSEENVKRFRQAKITPIHVDNSYEHSSTAALYKLAEETQKLEDVGYLWNERVKV